MSFWIVLFIFIVIAILTFVIIWAIWPELTQSKVSVTPSTPVTVGLLEPCNSISVCGDGLVCQNGICKTMLNGPCTVLSECATPPATVCNGSFQGPGGINNGGGTCQNAPIGGLGEACPCNVGLVEVTGMNGCICKGGINYPCQNDNQCQSGDCLDGFCTGPKTIGQTCGEGTCDTGLKCSLGFCQLDSANVRSGNLGAYCEVNQPWPPASGQQAPGCVSGTTCQNNICVQASAELNSSCSTSSVCPGPLICVNTVCSYQNNPNQCNNISCTAGFTCSDNECLGNAGQACAIDTDCTMGTCGPANTLLTYPFSTNFVTNGYTPWSTAGIPAGISFSRLLTYDSASTGASVSTIDVWGVDVMTGVYRLPANSSAWNLVLSNMLTTNNNGNIYDLSLIDFTINYSNNQGYAAYSIIQNSTIKYDAVFIVNLQTDGSGKLVAYNTTNSTYPGAQFDTNNNMLSITSIDVSIFNQNTNVDTLITGTSMANNTLSVYSKSSSASLYTYQVVGGMGRYYVAAQPSNSSNFPSPPASWLNFAYVSDNLVQFAGQIAQLSAQLPNSKVIAYPENLGDGTMRNYQIINYYIWTSKQLGIVDMNLWIVAYIPSMDVYTLFWITSIQTQMPGYYDTNTCVASTGKNVILSVDGVCS